MGFIPGTGAEMAEMLRVIGAGKFDDLLDDIPRDVRLDGYLDLPDPVSEMEAKAALKDLAVRNGVGGDWLCFLGGGAYDHYVPSIIDHIASRSEFYTAYTPYQPEISQGTLQSIYEFQSLITRLTGMEIANASLYDGGTALAEAVLMAGAINHRRRVVVSGTANPLRLGVLKAYLQASGIEVSVTGHDGGATDPREVAALVDARTCCVVLENPNFFGIVEDGAVIADVAGARGALFVVAVDPISLGVLSPPGAYGADIVVGEGQALGNRLSFGGPYLGFIAARRDFIRRIPGRIVGRTVDAAGQPCFCLTLQTREQHIRREHATSNICTNQALNALRAAVYLCWLGKCGIAEVAGLCLSKAVYAVNALSGIGLARRFQGPLFKEFVIDLPVAAHEFVERMAQHRILPGLPIGRFYPDMQGALLVAVTEKRSRREIDRLVEASAGTLRAMGARR